MNIDTSALCFSKIYEFSDFRKFSGSTELMESVRTKSLMFTYMLNLLHFNNDTIPFKGVLIIS